MRERQVPKVVVNRLPLYLRLLYRAREEGMDFISSQELGARLGYTAAQVRKDFSYFGEFGKQGTGYPVNDLITRLEHILQVDRTWDMALVGVGDLGHALARYQGFARRGFRVVMLFDNDPRKIGTIVGHLLIRDAAKMEEDIRQAGIQIAVITTPASAAQQVADRLVSAGVRAILNYAPITLRVPEGVQVQYIDPVVHLQRMTFYL